MDLWNRFRLKVAMGHFFWDTLYDWPTHKLCLYICFVRSAKQLKIRIGQTFTSPLKISNSVLLVCGEGMEKNACHSLLNFQFSPVSHKPASHDSPPVGKLQKWNNEMCFIENLCLDVFLTQLLLVSSSLSKESFILLCKCQERNQAGKTL